ncbi:MULTISPECIES: DUF2630 family protein [unclassified Streptomyces]|uniref:DUF2630 family protein n=1 Tax=Streptomyces johnsoniae TaxID=3075532 RepID=A0ABU2S0A2_9ACTN|nr:MULTISPECIES: DUF2630 family protein [unclassified Streptomyces]MDT0442436.1 DUF2630 family protein [Streptomyces sp. DSM 41886]ONK10227.1 hypothetical protein STBA_09490 [Streptomyces sp. MP131-18]
MDDKDILARVGELVAEERALRERAVGHGLQEAEEVRLGDVEVGLDQCWDLLRQRRARSEFGDDPDAAALRPAPEVEGYES